MNTNKHSELANHAWSVADLLRGDYKQSDYGKVILPFTVLRRLECVLEPTREKVHAVAQQMSGGDVDVDPFLRRASGTAWSVPGYVDTGSSRQLTDFSIP